MIWLLFITDICISFVIADEHHPNDSIGLFLLAIGLVHNILVFAPNRRAPLPPTRGPVLCGAAWSYPSSGRTSILEPSPSWNDPKKGTRRLLSTCGLNMTLLAARQCRPETCPRNIRLKATGETHHPPGGIQSCAVDWGTFRGGHACDIGMSPQSRGFWAAASALGAWAW